MGRQSQSPPDHGDRQDDSVALPPEQILDLTTTTDHRHHPEQDIMIVDVDDEEPMVDANQTKDEQRHAKKKEKRMHPNNKENPSSSLLSSQTTSTSTSSSMVGLPLDHVLTLTSNETQVIHPTTDDSYDNGDDAAAAVVDDNNLKNNKLFATTTTMTTMAAKKDDGWSVCVIAAADDDAIIAAKKKDEETGAHQLPFEAKPDWEAVAMDGTAAIRQGQGDDDEAEEATLATSTAASGAFSSTEMDITTTTAATTGVAATTETPTTTPGTTTTTTTLAHQPVMLMPHVPLQDQPHLPSPPGAIRIRGPAVSPDDEPASELLVPPSSDFTLGRGTSSSEDDGDDDIFQNLRDIQRRQDQELYFLDSDHEEEDPEMGLDIHYTDDDPQDVPPESAPVLTAKRVDDAAWEEEMRQKIVQEAVEAEIQMEDDHGLSTWAKSVVCAVILVVLTFAGALSGILIRNNNNNGNGDPNNQQPQQQEVTPTAAPVDNNADRTTQRPSAPTLSPTTQTPTQPPTTLPPTVAPTTSQPTLAPTTSAVPTVAPTRFEWKQLGGNIDGEFRGDMFGYAVALNEDGTIMAAGARYNDLNFPGGQFTTAGHVRVFRYDGGTIDNATGLSNGDNGWFQMGSDIDAEEPGDWFGESVVLSKSGLVVAAGSKAHDRHRGQVRVFAYNDDDWVQLGEAIEGLAPGDDLSRRIAMNGNGTIIAAGAHGHEPNGQVRVFRYETNEEDAELGSGNWTVMGSYLDAVFQDDIFGNDVALSQDGTILAASSRDKDYVRIYEWDGQDWQIRGTNSILVGFGYFNGEQFGQAISLSADGNILAVSDNGYQSGRGVVRVFQYDEGRARNYVPLGQSQTESGGDFIFGEYQGDRFGYELALSDDGHTLVASSYINNGTTVGGYGVGHMRVFRYTPESDAWTQVGSDIDGLHERAYAGWSVAISGDGTRVAYGAEQADGFSGPDSGRVRVFG